VEWVRGAHACDGLRWSTEDVTQRIARSGAEKWAGDLTTGSARVASTRMAAVLIYSGLKKTDMARKSSSSRRNYRLSLVILA